MNRINKVCIAIVMIFILSLSIVSTVYAETNIEGKGTQSDPYILDFNLDDVITLNYGKNKNNFFFKIKSGGKVNGAYTYKIEKGDDNSVKFTKTNNNDRFVYTDDSKYSQAGAIPLEYSEGRYKDSGFQITSIESAVGSDDKYYVRFYSGSVKDALDADKNIQIRASDGRIIYGKNLNSPQKVGIYYSDGKNYSRKVVLANAPAEGSDKPDLNYFVLTPGGTVEELYERTSQARFSGANTIEGNKNDKSVKRLIYKKDMLFGSDDKWELALSRNGVECQFVTLCSADSNGNMKDADKYRIDVVYEFKITNDNDHAGVIETAITWLLLGLGEIFMLIIKSFLGSDLSMDAIIFNRYNATILDLGAILYGKGPAVGMLGNANVIKVINTIYFGFQTLAIAAYIVMLLYIGIKVLMEVGGPKQSKWMRYVESWIMGVLILLVAPRFFHYITDITNSIVAYIGKDSKPYYSQYNISTMLNSEALYGENANTLALAKDISEGINLRDAQLDSLNKKIQELESDSEKFFDDHIVEIFAGRLRQKISELPAIIANIFGGKNDETDEEKKPTESLENMLNDLKNFINDNRGSLAENDPIIVAQYNEKREYFMSIYDEYYASILGDDLISKMDDYYTRQMQIATVENELKILNDYQSGGNNVDIMADIRVKAGETGRLVYAIVWLSLIIQLISLLGMYYKRILVVIILIMIFPIVMITYAIDKAGDGSAQTLGTWFKEFTVNILVQIIHAVIYVTLIDAGLKIYSADNNNWLLFFLAVIFIFPAERILRSVFGISGSTIGNLNANLGGKLAAAGMVGSVAKNGYRLAKKAPDAIKNAGTKVKSFSNDVKKNGLGKTVSTRWDNYSKKERNEAAKKNRQAQSRADNRKNLRDAKIAQRKQQIEHASGLRKKRLQLMNGLSHARNGFYHTANLGRKVKSKVNTSKFVGAYKMTKGALKTATGVARKAGGIAVGVTDGVIKAGSSGLSAGIVEGVSVGRTIGGFKSQPKPQKKPKVSSTPNQSHKPANMPGGQKPLGATTKQVNKPGAVAKYGAGGGRQRVTGVKKTTKVNKKVMKRTKITSTGNNNSH